MDGAPAFPLQSTGRHERAAPPKLRRDLSRRFGVRLAFQPLFGGRTNSVWRVRTPGAPGLDLVCKLVRPGTSTPLFANSPDLEFQAQRHLAPLRLAPRPIARLTSGLSDVLVYRHVAGTIETATSACLLMTLYEVHQTKPPNALRRLLPLRPALSPVLRRRVPGALAAIGASKNALSAVSIAMERAPGRRPVLIHGDPVPANVIRRPNGRMMLIDWQGPHLGDPCRDLSIALSPAMHRVYGAGPLRTGIDAYPCPETRARYRLMAPALHAQIIAHCLLRSASSRDIWFRAAGDELAELEECAHGPTQTS